MPGADPQQRLEAITDVRAAVGSTANGQGFVEAVPQMLSVGVIYGLFRRGFAWRLSWPRRQDQTEDRRARAEAESEPLTGVHVVHGVPPSSNDPAQPPAQAG